ncbi:MAG: hypothetical protein K6A65_06320 [Succinivibrionaceae bacterium]|nr:hypothetical protein [Succinivibrionaceae bacterium]
MAVRQGVVAALWAAVLTGCGGGGPTPESTAVAFFEHLARGEGDAALALVEIPGGERGTGQERMVSGKIKGASADFGKTISEAGGLERVTATKTSSRGNEHYVSVEIRAKGGMVKQDHACVVRSGEALRISLDGCRGLR